MNCSIGKVECPTVKTAPFGQLVAVGDVCAVFTVMTAADLQDRQRCNEAVFAGGEPELASSASSLMQQRGRAKGIDEPLALVGQHERVSIVDVGDIECRLQARKL